MGNAFSKGGEKWIVLACRRFCLLLLCHLDLTGGSDHQWKGDEGKGMNGEILTD